MIVQFFAGLSSQICLALRLVPLVLRNDWERTALPKILCMIAPNLTHFTPAPHHLPFAVPTKPCTFAAKVFQADPNFASRQKYVLAGVFCQKCANSQAPSPQCSLIYTGFPHQVLGPEVLFLISTGTAHHQQPKRFSKCSRRPSTLS
jgi:hypothetical protein